MGSQDIPGALKNWFILHFAVDVIFAIPLFFFPVEFLTLMGWQTIDPLATRIAAAALFAIGIESFLGRNAEVSIYKNMLNLKIIWSAAAVAGIALSIGQAESAPFTQWLLLAVFLSFHILWVVWRIRVAQILTRNG